MSKERAKMNKDTQIDKLRYVLDGCATALRWLWMTNLVAAIAGAALGRYELTTVAGISLLAALVGTAGVGRALRILTPAVADSSGDQEE